MCKNPSVFPKQEGVGSRIVRNKRETITDESKLGANAVLELGPEAEYVDKEEFADVIETDGDNSNFFQKIT